MYVKYVYLRRAPKRTPPEFYSLRQPGSAARMYVCDLTIACFSGQGSGAYSSGVLQPAPAGLCRKDEYGFLGHKKCQKSAINTSVNITPGQHTILWLWRI
jgi:hypothetical protein